mgnify:CR=1 FL=1
MKQAKTETNYFFVDESGDPTFYDNQGRLIIGKEGVSQILILGFVKTENPKPIRLELENLRKKIANDNYLQGIPSLKKSLIAFHAKDDCPEVREKVFRLIVKLDFTAELFVARKNLNIFNKRHHRNENEFYDDLISKLFENKLHLAKKNEIYFAVRGSKTRQVPLRQAIEKAAQKFESKWNKKIESVTNLYPQSPSGEPCLQVIDYINWAVQRAFIKKEMRFYKFVEDKIKYLVDIYDTDKYPKNFYSSRNKFDINKISPL